MSKIRIVIICTAVLILSGCFDPKIDGASEESLYSSLDHLYQTLPIEQSNQLKVDIDSLNEYFQRRIYKGEPIEEAQKQYLAILNRKTVSEVSEAVGLLKPYEMRADEHRR